MSPTQIREHFFTPYPQPQHPNTIQYRPLPEYPQYHIQPLSDGQSQIHPRPAQDGGPSSTHLDDRKVPTLVDVALQSLAQAYYKEMKEHQSQMDFYRTSFQQKESQNRQLHQVNQALRLKIQDEQVKRSKAEQTVRDVEVRRCATERNAKVLQVEMESLVGIKSSTNPSTPFSDYKSAASFVLTPTVSGIKRKVMLNTLPPLKRAKIMGLQSPRIFQTATSPDLPTPSTVGAPRSEASTSPSAQFKISTTPTAEGHEEEAKNSDRAKPF